MAFLRPADAVAPDHLQLRAHTAGVHAALHARFAGRLHGPGRHPTYLLGMHRTVAAFEAAGVPAAIAPAVDAVDAPRAALRAADLGTLGLMTLAPAALEFADAVEWLGGLYVVECSALGAGVLAHLHRVRRAIAGAARVPAPRRRRRPAAFAQARADTGPGTGIRAGTGR